jgi:hypothetical protein
MKSFHNDRFVADGYERCVEAVSARIRAEVEAEFRDEIRSVKGIWRLLMLCRVRRETRRRVNREAPPWALYIC